MNLNVTVNPEVDILQLSKMVIEAGSKPKPTYAPNEVWCVPAGGVDVIPDVPRECKHCGSRGGAESLSYPGTCINCGAPLGGG